MLVIPTLLLISLGADAQDPQAGKATFTQKACFACHGDGGLSQVDTYPVLAGKPADYLSGELRRFRSGERANPTMNSMAGGLTDSDILNIAAYLSVQGVVAESGRESVRETVSDER